MDLFPDAVYVFTPKSQIMALPRGATVVDFAYAIHSNVGDRTTAAKINNEQVPLRTGAEKWGCGRDHHHACFHTEPRLAGVRTHRTCAFQDTHYLKTLAHTESESLGEKLLIQAIRAEGLEQLPPDEGETHALWEKLLRFTGNRNRSELLTDLGLGKRIASIVAKRLVVLLGEHGHRPDALLLTRERYTPRTRPSPRAQSRWMVVKTLPFNMHLAAARCRVIASSATWAAARGWSCTTRIAVWPSACSTKTANASLPWTGRRADTPVRNRVVVTVINGKGVRTDRPELANSEADITHVDMDDEAALDTTDLRFVVAVRDQAHLEAALRNLRRTQAVIRANRITPQAT